MSRHSGEGESSGIAMESHVAARHSESLERADSLDGLVPESPDQKRPNEDDGGSEQERLLEHDLEDYELDDLDPVNGNAKKYNEEDDSPYPEVRAAVRNYDEDVPCGTVRAWTIGLGLVVIGASMNTLFSLRQPTISVTSLLAQVVAYPLGHAWAAIVPARTFTTFGRTWSLNPGPFNIKEHSIIVVMAGVSFSVAYSTDIILAQMIFYKQNFGLVFQILLTICTQSLGYGMAGVMRKFLVYPAAMIWPTNLVNVSLMNAMHDKHDKPDPRVFGGSMSRYKWFTLVSAVSFFYFFLPGYLAKCLSLFAPLTWLAPQNVVVNQLFGENSGMSLLPITFDWSQIAGYIGSPMMTPWIAIANTLLGVVFFFMFLVSVLHYSGVWYAPYLPISDARTFDNMGLPYNTTRVLNPDFTLNVTEYKNYSPLFISTTFALTYGLSFAAITSLLVYTYIHSGKTIWKQYRNSGQEKPDIHMRLMSKYPETPTWWYGSLFFLMLGISFYTVLAYPTNMSWWTFLLAVMISFAFTLPVGIIEAITNARIGLNVLTEFVYGYIEPGRPLALMLFKTFGYISMSQALSFVADLKFGHYMKIPPRTMFLAQVVATTLSCVIQVFVLNFALANIDNVCDLEQVDRFTCPGGRVFFSASVIWGLIGPARMFSPGQIYFGLFSFFIIGAITPIIIHLASKRWPKSPMKHLMAPLIFGGSGNIPPATPLNYISWSIVGYFFQSYVKRRYTAWWTRLNFITSCGLDFGLALGTFVLFFAFTIHNIKPPRWWANTIVESTMDYQGTAVRMHVAEGKTFGPASW